MLFKNGRILPICAPEIASGWLQVEDGKILALGAMDSCPDYEGECIDLAGKTLMPGMIDAHCHIGLLNSELGFPGVDVNEMTDPVTPQMNAVDGIYPSDRCFAEALASGVTTVVTGPGSGNVIGGQMAAIKTCGHRVEEMILRAPLAMKMAFGENPKRVYNGKNRTPMTRMATASILRETLTKAREYMGQKDRADAGNGEAPKFDAKYEALLPLLRGEMKAHIHAHRADDILTAIRIMNEFRLSYMIVHGTEGHLIAEDILAEGVGVASGPFFGERSKPELTNLTPASPGRMSGAGVPVAIITDHPVIPLERLPICAGLAVREGMDYEKALRAITLTPAELCEIDDRVGSLAPGKDADLLVFAGDPLSIYEKPEMVFVNGEKKLG